MWASLSHPGMTENSDIHVEVARISDAPPGPPPGASGPTGPGGPRRHPNTCPSCASHYRDDELRAALRVCRVCGYHFVVGARERIEQLADPDSFLELAVELRSADPLAFTDLRPYVDRLAEAEQKTDLGDAMVVGGARIEGLPCALAVMDFAFMGGSMGSVVGELFTRACDDAVERAVPLVSVSSSGGARMQENILALMQMAKTTVAVDSLHEARVPYLSVLAHPTTGGVVASFASLGDVLLAEPGALLSFAGPRVVQQTTGAKLPADFGLAESSYEHGLIDLVVPRGELRTTVGRLLRLCAGGTLTPIDPVGIELPVAEPGALGRLFRRLRRRGHGPVEQNGASHP